MNPTPPPFPAAENEPAPKLGLAIACLICGVLALLGSVIVIGALIGVAGVILGIAHLLRRQQRNGMAWAGMILSVLGIFAGIGLGVAYFQGAKKFYAELMEASAADEEDLDAWKGVLAPDLMVTTLDGKEIKLSELRGRRVIVDFWATWCPPCVKEIPHFIQLRNEVPDDELSIVGISNEEKGTLEAFIKKKGINYPIAIAEDDLLAPYSGVQAIPTTFFIDRNGVIQDILVGYHDFAKLKEHATAADYQGEPKSAPEPPASGLEEAERPLTLATVWTLAVPGGQALCTGDWDGDGTEEVLVACSDQKLRVVGADGAEKGVVNLSGEFQFIELGRKRQGGPRLLGYSNWGNQVVVKDVTGKTIWTYPSKHGVDGAHWGDLDGDGDDEMIVGMNGSGGLHAVSSDGKKLWNNTSIGNVWNQSVCSAGPNQPARVFATEAGGSIQMFDGDGKRLNTARPMGKYFSQMAAARMDPAGTIQIAATREVTVGVDESGAVIWSTPAVESAGNWRRPTFACGDVNRDGTNEWAFVDITGDLVLVAPNGVKLGGLPSSQSLDGFAIVYPSSTNALLVTMQGGTLQAYRAE